MHHAFRRSAALTIYSGGHSVYAAPFGTRITRGPAGRHDPAGQG